MAGFKLDSESESHAAVGSDSESIAGDGLASAGPGPARLRGPPGPGPTPAGGRVGVRRLGLGGLGIPATVALDAGAQSQHIIQVAVKSAHPFPDWLATSQQGRH